MTELRLHPPAADLVDSYLESIAEMRACGETIWPGWLPNPSESPGDFADRLRGAEQTPGPVGVPESIFWAVRDGTVVGRITLRHHLTEALTSFGGHVGYEVRPSYRRRGLGKEMLRQLLRHPKARAIGQLLLTCSPDNVGSNKTILASGGVLERTAFLPDHNRWTNYYRIDVPARRE